MFYLECLILAAVAMAIWSYIYEGILAPSFRLCMRNKLFAIRDQLRKLNAAYPEEINKRLFDEIHDSINFFIPRLHMFGFFSLLAYRRLIRSNKTLREDINGRIKRVKECKVPGVQDVMLEYGRVIQATLCINLGGWLPYLLMLVPLFAIAQLIGRAVSSVKERIQQIVKTFSLIPSEDGEKLMPLSENPAMAT